MKNKNKNSTGKCQSVKKQNLKLTKILINLKSTKMKKKASMLIILFFLFFNSIFLFPNSSKAQMFWNQACSFAGTSSSYISCRNTSTTNITGNFTLEAWINPSTLSGFSKGIISKGGALGTALNYGMRLESSGRIVVVTNGAARLRSKTTTLIPLNQWTHVSATFHFNTFVLYINGVSDTAANVGSSGISPLSNTDSLFIGISGSTTPFSGMLDEVRIWNRDLSYIEVKDFFRLSLGTNSGIYSGLILSMTFQKENSAGVQFTANDWSNTGNYGTKVGVSQVNLSDQPSKTILTNPCLSFFTSSAHDYLAGPDNSYVSPTSAITLQAWIMPTSNAPDRVIIHKGTANGSTTNYSLNIINQKLAAKINGTVYDSQDTLPTGQWSHVAFTYRYNGITRIYNFYVNGKIVRSQFSIGGSNIADGSDSLYIGGTNLLTNFYGYIDEVRISNYAKSQAEIMDSLYTPMENGFVTANRTVAYNFDGYTYCNSLIGPFLYFRNFAYFTFPLDTYTYPISPLDKGYSINFQNSFLMKTANNRIPETGFSGPMKDDTLNVLSDETISDVNVFVALNHPDISDLKISLIAPNGTTVQLMNANSLKGSAYHLATVFDDQASFPMTNNTYVSFSPTIRPLNSLNVFNGLSTKGQWHLAINENSTGSGRLYSWGLRFNNKTTLPKTLSCKSLIQGFYNNATHSIVRDTMRCYLRSISSPYPLIDSAKSFLQDDGTGLYSFNNSTLTNGVYYYIQLNHRNSIETWSSTFGALFDASTSQAVYDFTNDTTKAFGNNLIQVDNSPVKYAIYSGDVNQDGTIDLSDIQLIDNDALNFSSGYVSTDVNGDGFVDLNDLSITDNNASNFVSKITP
jgi:subtilisin-like proprotein convertase family protein